MPSLSTKKGQERDRLPPLLGPLTANLLFSVDLVIFFNALAPALVGVL